MYQISIFGIWPELDFVDVSQHMLPEANSVLQFCVEVA